MNQSKPKKHFRKIIYIVDMLIDNIAYEEIFKCMNDIPTLVRETRSVADPKAGLLHITIRGSEDGEMQTINEYDEKLTV